MQKMLRRIPFSSRRVFRLLLFSLFSSTYDVIGRSLDNLRIFKAWCGPNGLYKALATSFHLPTYTATAFAFSCLVKSDYDFLKKSSFVANY